MTTPAAPTTAPAASGTTTTAPAGGRLPNGELRRQVAQVLTDQAGAELTPRNIAAALGGKSSGAIGNALAALTAGGYAEQTSTKPVRYRSTPTTADAAAAPVAVPSGALRRTRTPRTTTPPATTTPATPTAPAVTGPVTRPNGQLYHPRKLSGLPDVTALQKLRDAGVAALLYGPPGTGKTSVVEAAFGDLVTVQGDGDTTVADIVGEYTQTPDGKFVFVHGPLVRAMREGRTLFIDDATLIPPTVLAVVYPAMDGRRQIMIKANGGEVIDAAPGFYVVAGHNPGVHGRGVVGCVGVAVFRADPGVHRLRPRHATQDRHACRVRGAEPVHATGGRRGPVGTATARTAGIPEDRRRVGHRRRRREPDRHRPGRGPRHRGHRCQDRLR